MNLPVFFWRESAEFPKNTDEVALRTELKVVRDVADRILSERKKILCGIDPLFLDVLGNRDSDLRMEKLRDI